MADQWYYEAEGTRRGPFTGRELVALAAAGQIQPTATVWKEGVEKGVPAHRVKNLFPPGGADTAPAASAAPPPGDTAAPVPAETAAASSPPPAAPASPPPPESPAHEAGRLVGQQPAAPAFQPPPQPAQKKGRAVAVRGAVVVTQDGYTAYFRKVCPKCGHEDTGRTRMPIRIGLITRVNFFCPKCRKAQQAEIQSIG